MTLVEIDAYSISIRHARVLFFSFSGLCHSNVITLHTLVGHHIRWKVTTVK